MNIKTKSTLYNIKSNSQPSPKKDELLGFLITSGAACGATLLFLQPSICTLIVEHVHALRKFTTLIAFFETFQANGTVGVEFGPLRIIRWRGPLGVEESVLMVFIDQIFHVQEAAHEQKHR